MTEQDIIQKLQTLKEIKPRKDWVILAKSQILGSNENKVLVRSNVNILAPIAGFGRMMKIMFLNQYAFAGAIVLFVVMGTFGFSLKSNQTNMLSSVQKAVESSQVAFMTEEQKLEYNLNKADQQLDGLAKVAQEKDENKISPALNEYKASMSAAVQNLANETDKTKIKETVAKVKALENKEGLLQSLGVVFGENPEKDLALVKLITDQVKEIEARKDLSEENRRNVYQVKAFCDGGYFTEALDLILLINNTK